MAEKGVNNTVGNTHKALDFFLSRKELQRLKVELSQATLGEILELSFKELPKHLLRLGRQFPWYNKTLYEAKPIDIWYAFNFIKYELCGYVEIERQWGLEEVKRGCSP